VIPLCWLLLCVITVVGSRRDSEQGIPVVVLLSVCSSSLSVLWTV